MLSLTGEPRRSLVGRTHAGVTVWRAKPATGYGSLGDIVTLGTALPAFEVLTAAVNSGLVAYPTAYAQVWSDSGATIWRPAAPEGYVAAGDIVTLTPEPPRLSAMLCLHGECCMFLFPFFYLPDGRACTSTPALPISAAEHVVVPSTFGQLLSLPPKLPDLPAASAHVASSVSPVDFWCIENTLGTFFAATEKQPLAGKCSSRQACPGLAGEAARVELRDLVPSFPCRACSTGCCYDLRNPLGVSPASLASLPAAAPEAQEHGRCASVRRSVPAGPRLPSSPLISVQERPCSSGL